MREGERVLFEIDDRDVRQIGVAAQARKHVGLDDGHAAARLDESGVEALELRGDRAWNNLRAARLAKAVEVHRDISEVRKGAQACQLTCDIARIGAHKVGRCRQKPRGVQAGADHVDDHLRAVGVGAQLIGGIVERGEQVYLTGRSAGRARAREVVGQEGVDFLLLPGLRALRCGEGLAVGNRARIAGEIPCVVSLLDGRLREGKARCRDAKRAVLTRGGKDHAAHRLGDGGSVNRCRVDRVASRNGALSAA